MDTLSYKTISANKQTVNKEWLLIDAEGQTLGRFASRVALIIRGKHKPSFTPHVDCGDNVIIINAEKVFLTGNKMNQKVYVRHTGYPGGQRERTVKEMFTRFPERVLEMAIKRMLPKNKLGSELFRNLYVYSGPNHKQEAQQPRAFDINSIK
jgi:large subunit ribosomal protein L13